MLADRIKAARKAKALTKSDVDRLAGLTPGHTYQIECGRRLDPSGSTLKAIAAVLCVTVDELLAADESGPHPAVPATGTDPQ